MSYLSICYLHSYSKCCGRASTDYLKINVVLTVWLMKYRCDKSLCELFFFSCCWHHHFCKTTLHHPGNSVVPCSSSQRWYKVGLTLINLTGLLNWFLSRINRHFHNYRKGPNYVFTTTKFLIGGQNLSGVLCTGNALRKDLEYNLGYMSSIFVSSREKPWSNKMEKLLFCKYQLLLCC